MKNTIILLFKGSWKKLVLYGFSFIFLGILYYFFTLVLSFAREFSGLPYGLVKAFAGVLTLKLIDEIMLSEINTPNTLKNNATAYSIYIFAFALVVASALYAV